MKKFFILCVAIIIILSLAKCDSDDCKHVEKCLNCQGTQKKCKKEMDACFADKECMTILISPGSCIPSCTKHCKVENKEPFPLECVSKCVEEKKNDHYKKYWNCMVNQCGIDKLLAFLEEMDNDCLLQFQ